MTRTGITEALLLLLALLACNGSTSKPVYDPSQAETQPSAQKPARPIATQEYTPPPASTVATANESTGNAPEISRSAGNATGVVVLWPRIVLPRDAGKPDAETRALAGKAQARLADVARQAMPGAEIDVRPEPERVCPKQGCAGVSVGLLFARAGGGCSLIALVSAKGQSPTRLVPWSPGSVKLTASSVAFRDPPERVVHVDDYASCAKLPEDLAQRDGEIAAAIRSAAGH